MTTKEHWVAKVEYYGSQARYHTGASKDIMELLVTILTFLIDWRFDGSKDTKA